MAASTTLVLGGVRSGKSSWAESQFADAPAVTYVATAAREDDALWRHRVAAHQSRRPAHWRTVETLDLAGQLLRPSGPTLIDDLGNWVSRVVDRTAGWNGELDAFRAMADELATAWAKTAARVVLVSNEVGSGVHPPTAAGRIFADELGRLNAMLAASADEVVLLVAGLPLRIKEPNITGESQ